MVVQLDSYSKKFIKRFGLRVRSMRSERHWTLEHCEEMGITNWRHLQEVELGKKNVSLSTIIRIAKLFKVHPSDLLKDL